MLIAPFLFVAHGLHNLHAPMQTFHWTDEVDFHWPTILQMAKQWPAISLADYSSATTPLFHLLFAGLGKLVGFELYKLRACNVIISFMAVVVWYRLWRIQFGLSPASAGVLSLFFLLSPYFFGISFLLLTDNLAWLFCLLTLQQFVVARQNGRLASWLGACLCLSLALLTRQSMFWLGAVGLVLVLQPMAATPRGMRIGLLALAVAPLAWLVWLWGGLVPPSFQQAHEARSLLNLRAVGFSLALLGLYVPLLAFDRVTNALARLDQYAWLSLVAGLIYLLALPVGSLPSDDGLIWRVSRSAPSLLGSSVVFWLLIPAGCVALTLLVRDNWRSLGVIALFGFMLTSMASGLLYQKYFDPFIPLFVLLTRQPGRDLTRSEMAIVLCLCAAFVVYAWLPYRAT
ncbi:MAG: glycosyltransferase family 39 protein [Burkholderiales bacterium]|nr:glycosyltransferase family 39 protein [Burkholderiales bacterium]